MELNEFLFKPKIHLDKLPAYMSITASIVSILVDVFKKRSGFVNVNHGNVKDYFHKRFANERNQFNYTQKNFHREQQQTDFF